MSALQVIVEQSTIIVHQRDPDDLQFFRSAAKACAYFEPNDVHFDEYPHAYDVGGKHFRLITRFVPRRAFFGLFRVESESVDLVPGTQGSPAPELRDLLLAYLNKHGQRVTADQPLYQLIEAALSVGGYVS
jgi:hypothetical protein